jgi:hypothetical protein
MHTCFVELDITLPSNVSALLEVVEQALQQKLAGQGEVLRWAITALEIEGNRTAKVQAVVLKYATFPLDMTCEA